MDLRINHMILKFYFEIFLMNKIFCIEIYWKFSLIQDKIQNYMNYNYQY